MTGRRSLLTRDGVRTLTHRLQRSIEGPEGPQLAWTLRAYRPDQLSGDVISGLTVAALIVPLSIGYAGVAGLPPEVGLYASMAPLAAYAVFGSGRRLIVGPDASTAALIGAAIAPLAVTSDDRVRLASVLALIVAAIFVGMRLGKMGFLADFLSRPILIGYMTGVGLTVLAGQVPKLLGGPAIANALEVLGRIDLRATNVAAAAEAVSIAIRASGADLLSVAIGLGVVVAMLLGRRFLPKVPMALPAMIVALLLSYVFNLQAHGVKVLGPVPAGLPSFGIPLAAPSELVSLLPGALGLAILSFADTAATGRSFAARHGERTDANRELVALAAADAAGALTGGYSISSSASRTAAAEGSGSSSQLTGLVALATVAVVLLLLTGPLSYLPTPALGGVIFVSVLGIIDLRGILRIWRLKASEGLIAAITLGGVILYGTLYGVGIAVLLAALNIVRRAAWPSIIELGRMPNGTWHDLGRWADSRRVAGVITVRFPGPLFFANASALQARVRELVADRPDTTVVVLDLGATADIDVTAGGSIRELATDLERGGRRLAIARPMGLVRDELRAYGLADTMEATGGTHGSVDEAITGLGLDPTRTIEPVGPSVTPGASAAATAPADAATAAFPPTPETPSGAGSSGGVTGSSPQLGPIPPIPNRIVLRVLAGAVAVVVAAAVLGVAVHTWAKTEAVGPATVPNLVGMSLERASVAASDAGLKLSSPVFVRRDDQQEGTVVGQDPPAGTVTDRGASVLPLVSTGRQLVTVPDVRGQTEAQAIATLTGDGLGVRREASIASANVPAGSVVTTNPLAGTSVAWGTSVAYAVSTGPEPAPTPRPSASPSPAPSGSVPPATPASPSESPSAAASPSPAESPPEEPSPAASPS